MSATSSSLRPLGLAAVFFIALSATIPPCLATTEEAESYFRDAQKLLEKGDFAGAEIQLRNAARANPDDPAIHIQLASLYLKMGNLPAAEAEARQARQTHGLPDAVDPLLAEVLLRENKYNPLFQLVQPGNRAAKQEAAVRLALGLAHLQLQEQKEAEPLLRDAEHLDDTALRPKTALTRWFIQAQDMASAEAELARARAIAPDDREVMEVEGDLLIARGDTAGALAQFTSLLQKFPDDVAALITRANLRITQGAPTEAQQDIDHALKLVPNSPSAITLDALLAARAGDLQKADSSLSKISEFFGYFPYGYLLQGQVKYALGQIEQAKASLSKYVDRRPAEPLARRLLATIALRQRDPAAAIALLKPVVDADPKDAAAVTILANAYLAKGDRGKAVEIYQRAAEVQPGDALASTRAAVIRLELGQASEGLTQLAEVATTKEGAAIAEPLIVLTDLQSGKISDAALKVDEMVKRNATDIVAQNLMGEVRMAQQRYDDAAKIFDGVVQRDPSLLQVRHNLARAYLANQQPAEAKKAWIALLKEKPDDLYAMMAVAGIDEGIANYGEAADLLSKARQAAPNDPSPGISLLRIYADQQDLTKVKSLARDLEGQFPGDLRVVDAVAIIEDTANDLAGAIQEYQRFLQTSAPSAVVLQRVAELQIRAKDEKGARDTLAKALPLAPDDARSYAMLVALDLTTKGFDVALATARSFAEQRPVISDLIVANLLVQSGRSSDAIDALKSAQKAHPDTVLVTQLASLTLKSGDAKASEALLEGWLKDHADSLPPRLTLANTYFGQGEIDKAQANYEFAHDRFPNNVVALSNLALIYAKKGDARAADFAEQGYRVFPSPQTAGVLGWVMVLNGDGSRGLRFLQGAAAALPQDMSVQFHLAVAMKATGDTTQARSLLERVLKSDASFDGKDDARKLLAELQRG